MCEGVDGASRNIEREKEKRKKEGGKGVKKEEGREEGGGGREKAEGE